MSLINTCNLLLTNLHRCLDEAVKAVYGFAPLPVAGSLADRAASLKAAFDENPSAFVAKPTHLAALNSLLAEYRQQAFPANTTTITVEATRFVAWNDVTNKPVRFPPTAHAHDYASITEKPATFPPDAHTHDYASITDKPTTFPPENHAHDYASITGKPATFPPENHAHDYASITDKPTTFPPENHAHDLLQIGGLLLRYNSEGGYLEQSTNAGATWTPLVSESAPPSATAYALSWAGITDNTIQITRSLPCAWINGDLQIWMRVYLDADSWGTYLLEAETFNLTLEYDGAVSVYYCNRYGDWYSSSDTRTGLTGWHDIGLQWTQATNSAIIYIDGVGGTPLSVYKTDASGDYSLNIGTIEIKLSAFAWANALTWSASAATQATIGAITVNLPLAEGSGATATDSTGTAWTIPAGVVWEAL